MNRLFASIQILRPLNIILSLFAVFIAAWLVNGITSPLLPYTALVVLCFAGASNILNDVLDIHIDEVNRPDRVLSSGRLKVRGALIIMSILYALGIMATSYLHPLGKRIALILVLPLLVLYTPLFKRLPFIGNLVVGSILGLVFLFTEGSITGHVNKMWIPFCLGVTLSTIRELVKDAADIEGDAVGDLQTFPRKYGLVTTLWLLRILHAALVSTLGRLLESREPRPSQAHHSAIAAPRNPGPSVPKAEATWLPLAPPVSCPLRLRCTW